MNMGEMMNRPISRRGMLRLGAASATALGLTPFIGAADAPADLPAKARAALDSACAYFRSVGTHGGYLWSYSEDLRSRRGETKATETQIWVQPPGTPAIGMVFLRAFQVTGEAAHLEAARAAADALAYGQLESGGWNYMIDFDAAADKQLRRRNADQLSPAHRKKLRNVTTFDDNTTQSAIQLLLAVDQVKPADKDIARGERISGALKYALDGMLKAQYPNGAFPQAYMGAERNPADYPAKAATIPKDWHELPHVKEYWFHYTLNDNTHVDCLRLFLEAHRKLGEERFLSAARRAGDFLLLAKLPAPHPAWAQQYTPDMKPAWARKFEPPAACSHESSGAVRGLVDLYLQTGDEKYLEPIPAALDWLDQVKLKDGKWARFYELGTNRPLYMTRDYRVVYTDDDLPTHYGFQNTWSIAGARGYYESVKSTGRAGWLEKHPPNGPTPEERARRSVKVATRAVEAISALDEKGRWLSAEGISCKLFVENAGVLCEYLEGAGK